MEDRTDGNAESSSRRDFFKHLVNSIAAVIAATLGVPLAGLYILPALRKPEVVWRKVGPVDDFDVGDITLAQLESLERREWPEDWGREAAWVYRRTERDFTAYDLHCTHVGCPINWSPQAQRFFSPCHGGVFDKDGRVLAGPPPRPLDRYELKIENGVVYAGSVYRVNNELERVS